VSKKGSRVVRVTPSRSASFLHSRAWNAKYFRGFGTRRGLKPGFILQWTRLKRRSYAVLRAVRVGIWIRINTKVKGNGEECPFHTGRASLRSAES